MTHFRLSVLAATFLLASAFDGPVARAASEASDTADDPAYDDGWQHADDGGSGWGSVWNFNPGSDAGAIIGSSPAIDTAGRSFGLYNEADGSAIVVSRLFDGPLEVGQTFGVDVARDPGGREPAVWLIAGGTVRLRFSYSQFRGQYSVQDADGFYEIGPSEPDQAVRVDISLTGPDFYHLLLTPLGGESESASGPLMESGPITDMWLRGGGQDPQRREQFFNTITVPEPGAAVGLCAVIAGLWILAHARPGVSRATAAR